MYLSLIHISFSVGVEAVKEVENGEAVMVVFSCEQLFTDNANMMVSGANQMPVSYTHLAVLLADEPTGALDQNSGREVLKLFQELNQMGNTIVMITHDLNVARSARRIVRIIDGQLYE